MPNDTNEIDERTIALMGGNVDIIMVVAFIVAAAIMIGALHFDRRSRRKMPNGEEQR